MDDDGYLRFHTKITILGLDPSGYLCSGGNDCFSDTIQLEGVENNAIPVNFERCANDHLLLVRCSSRIFQFMDALLLPSPRGRRPTNKRP